MAGTITGIVVQARNQHRANVYIDGAYAFALSLEVATQASLKPGVTLSDQQIAELTASDEWQKNYDAALNFLSFRPRSETEVRRYLAKRKLGSDLSERVIVRLKQSGLLDDAAFARFWVENRETFSPRSSRALRSELRSKGIDDDTIAASVVGDDSEAAYRAGSKKARSLRTADFDTFRRKLLPFLQRRGFGYETARSVANRLWKELSAPSPDESDAAP